MRQQAQAPKRAPTRASLDSIAREGLSPTAVLALIPTNVCLLLRLKPLKV
jgi:hypothetical protein